MIEKTIAHYEILEKIGQGGMGIVYKARDTRLDRIVALKFLPPHLSSSDTDKARFIQEAKAASALNHANVCVVHDIQEADGPHGERQMFIVMEYIDGATVRARVPFATLGEAVGIAIQIGEALQEAHAKGIVHRDIKADNIMITAKNQVKVMDFGLAKLKGSVRLTKASTTVGTLAYMAPEQISGGDVDTRSDIFSFGVLLYEMLAGKTPFRGDHEAALVYSIVNEEPEPIQKFRPDVTPELLHILGRALEKDPNDRYQSVSEMVIDLRRLKKESTKVSRTMPVQRPAGIGQQAPTTAPVSSDSLPAAASSKKPLWIGAAVLLVLLAAAAYFFLPKSGQSAGGGAALNPNMTLHVLQIPVSQISYPGISSDGNWVSFPGGDRNGKWDIYYMHTSSNEPKRITNDSANFSQQVSDISPDGSQVAYTQANALYVASVLGGGGRRVVESAGNVRWRPDAQRLGYEKIHRQPRFYYELWSVQPDGSDNRLDFADSIGTNGRYSFSWSPDGKSVAWIRSFQGTYQEVITRDLTTGMERQLTFDKKNIDDVCWLRNGMILFSSNKSGNTNLWAVPVTGGAEQQITKGSGPDIGIAASADAKKVIYLQQQPVGYVWIASMSRPAAQQVTFEDRDIAGVTFSPDRKRIAYVMKDPDPLKSYAQLYVQDRDAGNRRQITTDEKRKLVASWSPDGRWIAYAAALTESPESAMVCLVEPDHPGTPRVIGPGYPQYWLSPTNIAVARANQPYLESVSLETGKRQKLGEDSTYGRLVMSGSMLSYFDVRAGKKGVWIVPSENREQQSQHTPLLIVPDSDLGANFSTQNAFFYESKEHLWWKYEYASGKRVRLEISAPGLEPVSDGMMSSDGEELVYVVRRLTGKLVMIENMFQ